MAQRRNKVVCSPDKSTEDQGSTAQSGIPEGALGFTHRCKGISNVLGTLILPITIFTTLMSVCFCLIVLNSFGISFDPFVNVLEVLGPVASNIHQPQNN
ncbi:hypothetical protein ACNA6I_23275 (plasmid) [Rossellomorea sp. FS2]|uniref:hypothetical protein n=1 Tax=Rossellomorea sp. FS2 TaxID=3391447 RepID=UPI003A4D2815